MVAMVIDTFGVRRTGSAADMRGQLRAGKFFWLDIFAGDDLARTELLRELGLESSDIAWALRFGQAGRMYIGRDRLRAVTWIADPAGNVHEVHVFSAPRCILTVWHGDAAALDEIRQQFGERVGGLDDSRFAAAAILLQLLIGTLDHAIGGLDAALDELRAHLDKGGPTTDFTLLGRRLQKLQSIMASFNRYSSAVRSAIVGIEAVAGMDDHGAAELNEYAEQVEDVEQEIYERRRWLSDIMHDNATAIAQRQGEQINRLTLVSLIFLPVTALSGFFGMNFNWMISHIDSGEVFIAFGILLPAISVIISIAYFRYRGLIQFNVRSRSAPPRPLAFDELPWPGQRAGQMSKSATADATGASRTPLSIRKTDEASA
jgi:Mg2+ and Co2+ transporter CorA